MPLQFLSQRCDLIRAYENATANGYDWTRIRNAAHPGHLTIAINAWEEQPLAYLPRNQGSVYVQALHHGLDWGRMAAARACVQSGDCCPKVLWPLQGNPVGDLGGVPRRGQRVQPWEVQPVPAQVRGEISQLGMQQLVALARLRIEKIADLDDVHQRRRQVGRLEHR
jgi:hypothetical protein